MNDALMKWLVKDIALSKRWECDIAADWSTYSLLMAVKKELERLAAVEAERDRLKAIVDTLPKTADFSCLVPDMHVWRIEDNEEMVVESIGNDSTIHVGGLPGVNDDCWDELAEDLFSTREAAEKARETKCET